MSSRAFLLGKVKESEGYHTYIMVLIHMCYESQEEKKNTMRQ